MRKKLPNGSRDFIVIVSIIGYIVLSVFLYTWQKGTTTKKAIFAQNSLICPTAGPKSALQMIYCKILPTPIPTTTPIPTATLTPIPPSPVPTATPPLPAPIGDHTLCAGKIVSFGIRKQLIPIKPYPGSGRPGRCIVPNFIVIHTTAGPWTTAEQVYQYFNGGAGGRGVASQFVIDKQGDAIQMGETLDTQIDVLYGTGNYPDAINIELNDPNVYSSKASATPAQYTKLLTLVKALMKQYNIPLGPHEYTWASPDIMYHAYPRGVYGHYQLNPIVRTDPGAGFLRDVRQDLAKMP